MKQIELDFQKQIVNYEAETRLADNRKQRQDCANAYNARYVNLLKTHTENLNNIRRRIAQLKHDLSKIDRDTNEYLSVKANIDALSAELHCAESDWSVTKAELDADKAKAIEEYDNKSREIGRWRATRMTELMEEFVKSQEE